MGLVGAMAVSSYDNQVRLYALTDPAAFTEQSELLNRFLFNALKIAPNNRYRLSIAPSSGWLEFTAVDQLWNARTAPILPSRDQAIAIARDLLTRLEQQCSDANSAWPASLRGSALLPPIRMLREVGIYAVPRPDGSAFDHWLYRAEPQLTLDGGSTQRVGVFGAQLEVRIGHGGQPVNVQSRWSPISGERKLTDLAPFHPPHNADPSSAADPAVMYLLEGDGVPQFYLAPYYFQFEGLDATMTSASPFSLTVDVSRTRQDDAAMTLTALAAGGSGDYAYNWAVYPMTDPTSGIRELGCGASLSLTTTDGQATASSIQIDNGAYVVMLNVKDQNSGAFKHHQQQFFSSPTPDDSGPTQTA